MVSYTAWNDPAIDRIVRGGLDRRLKPEIGVRVDLSLFPPDFFLEDRFRQFMVKVFRLPGKIK